MVKPPRKLLSFSESSPQFFKIYFPNQCSRRLQIPQEFIKYFNGDLPCKCTITSPAKRLWHVDVKRVNGHLFFLEGWAQFVQDNSLEIGEFLVFYYGGNTNFYVKMYAKNGCRKENRNIVDINQENWTVKQRESKRAVSEAAREGIIKTTLCPSVPLVSKEDERSCEAASKFKSKFPFFKVVMKPAYVIGGVMHIPSSFLKSYMEKDRQNVTLLVSDKKWSVKLLKYRRGNVCRFSRGWLMFSRENTIKAGDFCVFELVERNDFVLKVSIFRCLD